MIITYNFSTLCGKTRLYILFWDKWSNTIHSYYIKRESKINDRVAKTLLNV